MNHGPTTNAKGRMRFMTKLDEDSTNTIMTLQFFVHTPQLSFPHPNLLPLLQLARDIICQNFFVFRYTVVQVIVLCSFNNPGFDFDDQLEREMLKKCLPVPHCNVCFMIFIVNFTISICFRESFNESLCQCSLNIIGLFVTSGKACPIVEEIRHNSPNGC